MLSASAYPASLHAPDLATAMLSAFACRVSLHAPDLVTAMLSASACLVSLHAGSAKAMVSALLLFLWEFA
jgi:hypothetical protein